MKKVVRKYDVLIGSENVFIGHSVRKRKTLLLPLNKRLEASFYKV